jgi:hypothetical protein
MPGFGLRLTPQGRLIVDSQGDAPDIDARIAARLTEAFAHGTGHGLVRPGGAEVGQAVPPGYRIVPETVGDPVFLQLSWPCIDVQACGGDSLRRRIAP